MTSEKNDSTKEQLKRAHRVTIVLTASTVISILSIVFAFIQKAEADRSRELAIKLAEEASEVVIREREEAAIARKSAEAYSAELARTLSECAKNKK
jgi:hypothetical protein